MKLFLQQWNHSTYYSPTKIMNVPRLYIFIVVPFVNFMKYHFEILNTVYVIFKYVSRDAIFNLLW